MSTLKVGTINTPNGSGNITFSRPTVLQAGDIVEADIADNAITLAKMAGGTDGNIISYDASGDPVAVATGSSGQVLTSAGAGAPPTFAAAAGVATGFIGGLTISNNGSDAAKDIDIAVGSARDYTDAVTMTQGTAALTKRIDATWAVGDGNGGLDSTDAVAANTGYGVYLIRRSDTGVVDVLISSDMTAAGSALTMPTSYNQKRLIGWVKTNASSNIQTFLQSGDYFRLMTAAGGTYDLYDDSITNNTFETMTTTVPPLCEVLLYCMDSNGSTGDNYMSVFIKTKGASEAASNSSEAFLSVQQHDDMDLVTGYGNVLVDGSSQIEYACTEGSGAANITITTVGCVMHSRSNP